MKFRIAASFAVSMVYWGTAYLFPELVQETWGDCFSGALSKVAGVFPTYAFHLVMGGA